MIIFRPICWVMGWWHTAMTGGLFDGLRVDGCSLVEVDSDRPGWDKCVCERCGRVSWTTRFAITPEELYDIVDGGKKQ
jgi:hypothetical protein